MKDVILIVGLDKPEYTQIRERIDAPVLAHETLPGIVLRDGTLYAENHTRPKLLPVRKVVYHGIFEHDLDFITGLALWGGPSLPTARAMMDCRLKFPCLVRALEVTRFGAPRGYASPHMRYDTEIERVAKWGNWHCGENKERFSSAWSGAEPSIVEPYFRGQAVRVLSIGEHSWQVSLAGDDWLKSIHHDDADFMEPDADLLVDTLALKDAFGLEIIANDYIVGDDGQKYLLEVNHIPNVTRFGAVWQVYRDYVVDWIGTTE